MIVREGGDRCVVGTGESDDKGVVIGEPTSVSDLIGDVDGLDFTFCQSVVGVVGWVKGPGAIGIDGQARCIRGDGLSGVIGDGGGRREKEAVSPAASRVSLSVEVRVPVMALLPSVVT